VVPMTAPTALPELTPILTCSLMPSSETRLFIQSRISSAV
jgi:hypothetical protein